MRAQDEYDHTALVIVGVRYRGHNEERLAIISDETPCKIWQELEYLLRRAQELLDALEKSKHLKMIDSGIYRPFQAVA